jgi:hypothetical protein
VRLGEGCCGIDTVQQDDVLCDRKEWVQWSSIANMSIFSLETYVVIKETGGVVVAINVTRCQ